MNLIFHTSNRRLVLSVGLVSLVLVTIAAAIAWPFRQAAIRNDTDAWIPYRSLHIDEAVFLLRAAALNGRRPIRIVDLGPDYVDVLTSRYVVPGDSKRPGPYLADVSWASLQNLHRLPRQDLERAFGQDLATQPLEPLTAEDRVSFDSRNIHWYTLGDIVFATFFVSVLILGLCKVRNFLLWPLVLGLWTLSYGAALFFYSPALWDADLFHQRLIVDTPGDILLVLFVMCLPTSGLGVFLWRIMSMVRPRSRSPVKNRGH